MTPLLLVTSSLLLGQPAPAEPSWAKAHELFEEGLALRQDSAKARPRFFQAATMFDALWNGGPHSPELALARGRSYFLADDYPSAIVAFRQGLSETPYHTELLSSLELARDRVEIPNGPPEQRVRPPRMQGLRNRVSEWDVFLLGCVGALLLIVGVARRFTMRDSWSVPVGVFGALVLVIALVAVVQLHREASREANEVVLVVRTDVILRKGNGETYPERMSGKLPRGAEVVQIGKRGNWVQVRLTGGAVGWIPEVETLGLR